VLPRVRLAAPKAAASSPSLRSADVVWREGWGSSPRGAKRLVADSLATVRKVRTDPGHATVLLCADSALYGPRSHAGPDRVLGAAQFTAPATRVALGKRLDHTLNRTCARWLCQPELAPG